MHQILSQLNPKHARKPNRMAEQYFTPVTFSTTQSEFQLFWWNFHCVFSRSTSGSGQTSPSSSINVEITFLITFTITQSQICLHKQHVQVIQPSSGTLQPIKYNSRISTKGYDIINHNTGRSSFMPGLYSCKTLCKWNTKFPFKTKYSWELADCQPHHIYIYIYIYTGCPTRNVPDFGRVFLMLNYTDITQNTYIQSWTVMEIIVREKCGLHRSRRTVRRPWRHTCPMRLPDN